MMDLDHFTTEEKYQFWKWKKYMLINKSQIFQPIA